MGIHSLYSVSDVKYMSARVISKARLKYLKVKLVCRDILLPNQITLSELYEKSRDSIKQYIDYLKGIGASTEVEY